MADNTLSIFNSTLPTTATEILIRDQQDTSTTTKSILPSYVNVTITNGGLLNGSYDAWCINATTNLNGGSFNNASVYSSYGSIPTDILYTDLQTVASDHDPYLDKLQRINWLMNNVTEAANLVNNKYRYNNVDYTYGDVQLAIWKILGDPVDTTDSGTLGTYDTTHQKANDLIALAVTNGTDFVPVAGQDFGVIVKGLNLQPILLEVKTAGIGDFVWEDLNANGIQEANESGIDGATVTLLNESGAVIGTTTTGDNSKTTIIVEKGWYQFGPLLCNITVNAAGVTNAPSGFYQVKFTLPNGFNTVSPYLQGNNTYLDSNTNPSNNFTSTPITLVTGQINKTVDAGFFNLASLSGSVYVDANNNGVRDANETGIAGTTITLTGTDASGNTVSRTTTTDANGNYTVDNLRPGTYTLTESQPSAYLDGKDAVGTQGGTLNNDNISSITLTSGTNGTGNNFGELTPASIGDRVWLDNNANGIQDDGELGISNATVKLLNADSTVVATTTTGSDGLYSFTNLQPGDYKVQFVQPTGINGVSPANASSDDSVDSDGLISDVVNLSAGDNDTTVDSGLYKTASLGNFVFNDANNNGIQDTTEAGVSGVTVTLTSGGTDGLISTTGDNTTLTTTTNASGSYNFDGLTPGQQYQVGFSNLPAGYQFTQANLGTDDTVDSDASTSTGQTQIVTLASGENNTTVDAGIYQSTDDLSITKTDGLTIVTPGQQITYTIAAQNNGLITATNALVSDIMPTNLTNVTWTSVASGGATDNQTSGRGSINDYVTLTAGSSITYTVTGIVAANAVSTNSTGSLTTFDFNGSSSTDGTDGNTVTFKKDGISVTARAFSRVDRTNGAWNNAYLGSYSGGLAVTDSSESTSSDRVDNVGGRDNYVLFQFSESVVVNQAYLQYVVNDSDMSVWIAKFNNTITTLSDSILNSFGFTEINLGSSSNRWADINANQNLGNTLVIAAKTDDTEDKFKIWYLDVQKDVQKYVALATVSLTNTATVTAPTGFTDTNTSNNSATDTDTVIATPTVPSAPGVPTPDFWENCDWQKFWDRIQGNEPSQKTQSNFADSDLLFAPYTNSEQPGKVLDPVSGSYDIGLLIGDFNRNGKTDAGENTIFYTLDQARQIVDSNLHPNTDKRYDLGHSLVAGWLNYLAGNPIDTGNTTDQDERYYINEGINWLRALTPDENGDNKGDGAIYQMTGICSVNSPHLANSVWTTSFGRGSSLLSAYRSNTNVLYPLDSGDLINSNLDGYNNSLGLADNVSYGGNP
ncbi:SdrD B-like domain-containing protein [Trichormus azollae]|jgi:uncharacterized repeat protein (TIGR01451 family)|uniref:Conserved repeat domain protein n=1 Tax=Nostoc azollae (strain 0708) TaxID=551115 RepID=D7DWA6_NOSA0|nr:SdrD B-like domain-containing protein [Trichormus azollae]ADI64023.1 conserved repeat domain protein ['Nostoc azollae' 0708]